MFGSDDSNNCAPAPKTKTVAIVVPLIVIVVLLAFGIVLYRGRKMGYFRMGSWDNTEDSSALVDFSGVGTGHSASHITSDPSGNPSVSKDITLQQILPFVGEQLGMLQMQGKLR